MWSIFLLGIVLVEAKESYPSSINTSLKTLHNNPFTSSTKLLKTRDLDLAKRQCSGTCAECFGSGYTSCPGSDVYCYKPGDPNYGLDSCDSSSSGSDDTQDTTTDYCFEGSSCSTCFGSGYETCPDDSDYCYQPGNATSCCPDTCDDSTGGYGGSYTSSYIDYSSTSFSYSTPSAASTDSSYSYPTDTMTTDAISIPPYTGTSTASDTVPTETGDSVPSSSASTSVEQQTSGAGTFGSSTFAFGVAVLGWVVPIF